MHVPLQMHRFDFHGQVLPLRSDLETAAATSNDCHVSTAIDWRIYSKAKKKPY